MTTTRIFAVEGMSCAHCQAAVTQALKGVPGVASVDVDLEAKRAKIGYEAEKVTVEQLSQAVREAGYTLAPA